MNLDLVAHSNSFKSNFVYTDFFINQECNVLLLTHTPEKSKFLDEINSHIVNSILNLKINEIPQDKIKDILEEYFKSLNWQLYSKFSRSKTKEFGISFFLCITLNKKAYFVQFGRMLCGKIENNKFKMIGNRWENYFGKSKDEIFLLGSRDENIKVKIYETLINMNSYFFAIPALIAQKIITESHPQKNKIEFIRELARKEKFPYFIFKSVFIKKSHQIWFKSNQKRFVAGSMLFIIILSTLYVFYGKNWLADKQNILQERNKDFVRNELQKKVIETQEILNSTFQEIYELNLFPNKKMNINSLWEKDFEYTFINPPLFDMHNLYLTFEDHFIVLKKKSDTIKWEQHFKGKIINTELLDANRLLIISSDGKITCFNRETGFVIWEKDCDFHKEIQDRKNMIHQISIEKFKQLDNSMIIVPDTRSISFINLMNGETISKYETENEINYISEYDIFERSLYLIEGEKVIQIRLDVKLL